MNQINLFKESQHRTNTMQSLDSEQPKILGKDTTNEIQGHSSIKDRRATESDAKTLMEKKKNLPKPRLISNTTGMKIFTVKENTQQININPIIKEGIIGLPSLIEEGITNLFLNFYLNNQSS